MFLAAPSATGEFAGALPVVTMADVAAIGAAVRCLTSLADAHRRFGTARVILAGTRDNPMLCPLLIAAGISDITTWEPGDAAAFPLREITECCDVLVDLLEEGLPDRVDSWEPIVVAPDRWHTSGIVLPGLCAALAASARPPARPTVEMALACVYAVILGTPAGQQSPEHATPELTGQIREAVAQALARPDSLISNRRTSNNGE